MIKTTLKLAIDLMMTQGHRENGLALMDIINAYATQFMKERGWSWDLYRFNLTMRATARAIFAQNIPPNYAMNIIPITERDQNPPISMKAGDHLQELRAKYITERKDVRSINFPIILNLTLQDPALPPTPTKVRQEIVKEHIPVLFFLIQMGKSEAAQRQLNKIMELQISHIPACQTEAALDQRLLDTPMSDVVLYHKGRTAKATIPTSNLSNPDFLLREKGARSINIIEPQMFNSALADGEIERLRQFIFYLKGTLVHRDRELVKRILII